jgi:hypothetical protein
MVGDAGTSGPVGNIVAQIEQGSKVFSGIHRRLHKTIGDEFIHIAELNGEYLPEAYPFTFNGVQDSVLRADFDDRIDVIPVSDPNIFSAAQRISLAQSAVQTIQQYPQLNGDLRGAVIELLGAMNFPNPDRLFPPPESAVHTDPVTEGVYCTLGKPVKSFIDQNHQAHLSVHQFQLAQYQQMNNPQAQQSMMAHIQEHTAMQSYMEIVQQMEQLPMQAQQTIQQMQQAAMQNPMLTSDPNFQQQYQQAQQQATMQPMLPQVNWDAPMMSEQMPPEMENDIALRAAQIAQQMFQQMQQANDPEAQKQAQEQAKAQATKEAAQINANATVDAANIRANADVQKQKITTDAQVQMQNMQMIADKAKMEFQKFEALLEDRRKRDEIAAKLRMERELTQLKLNAEKDQAMREEMQTRISEMDEKLNAEPEDDGEEMEVMKAMMESMMSSFTESMGQMTDKLTAPKKLVFDKQGKPIGVEPGEVSK